MTKYLPSSAGAVVTPETNSLTTKDLIAKIKRRLKKWFKY